MKMENEVRLIDANALTEKLREAEAHKGMGAAIAGLLIRYIGKMPTIDPESLRPKGRWVYDAGNMEMACSECLCAAHVRCGDKYDYILSDYCPNCGADMREG